MKITSFMIIDDKKGRSYNLRRQKNTGFMIKGDKNYISYVLSQQNI